MSYKLSYDGTGRLIISDIVCSCGGTHCEPAQDIYVGKGILENIPGYVKKRGLGKRCVLVADRITWDVAGHRVCDILRNTGFAVDECLLIREGVLDPDETAVGEVFLALQPDTDFLVSVGSGSITDTVRVVAARTGLPQVCVGTAPSMDGYTSSVCPLTYRGLKIHRPGVCPPVIVCDIDILKTAPPEMVNAGVGDVLGKYIARTDWKIGQIINGEVYCDVCGEIITDALTRVLDNLDGIKSTLFLDYSNTIRYKTDYSTITISCAFINKYIQDDDFAGYPEVVQKVENGEYTKLTAARKAREIAKAAGAGLQRQGI